MAVVLVVNDDDDMLDAYESVLRSLGHKPVTRLVIESGVETIRQVAADALLIDLQRPDEDAFGMRIIEEVRSDQHLSETPIILCSGAPEAIRRLQPRLARLRVPVVVKPFSIDALEGAIRAVLDGKPRSTRLTDGPNK